MSCWLTYRVVQDIAWSGKVRVVSDFLSYATGWFKLTAPNSFTVQCPRRLSEINSEIFTLLKCSLPCRAVNVFLSVFFQGLSWANACVPARGWAGPSRRPINFFYNGRRPGPACQIFRGWAAARPGPSNFGRTGRGPARPIKISEDGPPPNPAHHIFNFSRPGPSIFQNSRPGPVRPRQTAHDKPCFFSFATYLGSVLFAIFGS